MKWESMQKPLREGMQVFRIAWPEAVYIMVEDGQTTVFTGEHPEGLPYEPTRYDLLAEDWAATGLSGE